MFWNAARHDLPGLDDQLAAGDCQPLRRWLAERIHAEASLQPASELCSKVCGQTLQASPFIEHLRTKHVVRG